MNRLRPALQHPDTLSALLLALLTILFFLPAATMHGIFFYGSATDFFARLAYSAERFRALQLPLWNPYLSLGGTNAADPLALTWYLPAQLLFQVLPRSLAFNATIILHYYFAGLGMYLLAKSWKQRRPSALLAALVFEFGGFLVAHLQQLNVLIALAWLPWILLCLELYFMRWRVLYPLLGALAFGLQILGGQFEVVLYSTLTWSAYVALRLVRGWRAGAKPQVKAQLLSTSLMFLAGLGIGAIFLVPYFELLNFIAPAGGQPVGVSPLVAYPPARLITFLYPYFYGGNPGSAEYGGSIVELTAYIGIIPLVLALLALARGGWRVLYLLGVIVIGFLLGFGLLTPLFTTLTVPARALAPSALAFALLAGFGLEELRRAPKQRLTTILLIALGSLLIGMIAFALSRRLGSALPADVYQATVNRALWVSGGMVLSALVLVFMWRRGIFSERVRLGLTLVLVFVDLLFFGISLRQNTVALPLVFDTPGKSARAIQREDNRYNIYFWDVGGRPLAYYLGRGQLDEYYGAFRAGIQGSLPLYFKLHSMQGYGSEPPAYSDVVNRIERNPDLNEPGTEWLGKYGVQVALTPLKPEVPYMQMVERNGEVSFSRLNHSTARVALAQAAQAVRNPTEALQVLDAGAFQDGRIAIEAPTAETYAPTEGSFEIVSDDPEHVTVSVHADTAPTYLVLNDTFYPGWIARVDGQPAPLYRANGLVRAVPVPVGTHRVEFEYDPISVKIGAGITLVTLLLIVGGIVWAWRRGR